MSSLCLGTAQLGLPYGIANRGGQPNREAAFALLATARETGVALLDTSPAYGTSEAVIGGFHTETGRAFDVVSKWPKDGGDVDKALAESLARLRTGSLYGYLVHDFGSFEARPEIWEGLQVLKAAGRIKKAGFSVYFPREVALLLEKDLKPDIVQLPFSVLDQRFAPLLPELKKRAVEVHARSVFLQGAVFLPDRGLTGVLEGARGAVERLRALALRAGLTVWELCLAFVAARPEVDRLVVGAEAAAQWRENVAALAKAAPHPAVLEELQQLALGDEAVLVPALWRNKA